VNGERARVYLVHGSDEAAVYRERSRLVSTILPPEHRAENLTEIEPPGNRPLKLRNIFADLVAELRTPSFFPEVPRVVVVEQLADLLMGSPPGAGKSAERKGKTASGTSRDNPISAFCRFLEEELSQTGNFLIISIVENPDKRRRINVNSQLYKTISSVGRIIQYKQPQSLFQFIDAFSERNLAAALKALAEVLETDDGPASAYRMLVRAVRFLIQAKLLERFGVSPEEAKAFAAEYFPPQKGMNLLMEPGFSVTKIRRSAARWTLAELNALLPRLESITKVIYPSVNDTYVPDPRNTLELFVIEACSAANKSREKR